MHNAPSGTQSNALFPSWGAVSKPVIGMLHLGALPLAPRFAGSVAALREAILRDADALAAGGVHALMMENFGDTPFYPGRVPVAVAGHMTAIAVEVKRRFPQLPLGINVLRNDGQTALAVAHASGAQFIRVNVLCGARVTDQGLVQGIAHELLRERAQLGAAGADGIRIFADVDVKHSAALAQRPLVDEVDDVLERGGADALVVSGAGTGKPTDPAKVAAVKAAASKSGAGAMVFIGSGATAATVGELAAADGFIVGTAFKQDGLASNPVEVQRVRELLRRLG
jgi:membrane complex biogenesis BtpA family protein